MKTITTSQEKIPYSSEAVREWFASDLGADVLNAERRVIDRFLTKLSGTHLLHIGSIPESGLTDACPAVHRTLVYPELVLGMAMNTIICQPEELPVEHDSIDTVLLHHALDFTTDPHQVLREATRVMKPGGHMVIVGFNPVSLWGLDKCLTRQSKKTLWQKSQLISHHRLIDWTKLLGLTEERTLSDYYLPPFSSAKLRNRFMTIQAFGRKSMPGLGAFYAVMVRKDVASMTPITQKRFSRPFISIPMTKPATRGHVRETR